MKSSQQDLKMQCKPAVSEVNMTQLQGGKTLRRSDSETFIGPECFFWISFFLAKKSEETIINQIHVKTK